MLGPADGLLVVLDDDQGVPSGLQGGEGVEQQGVVPGVQADGGLVEDIADAAQVGAELGGEADALGLAAGQGGGAPVEAEIAESHPVQEGEPVADLREQIAGDDSLALVQLQSCQGRGGLLHRQGRQVGDGVVVEAHRQGLAAQPLAVAGGAGLGTGRVGLLPLGLFAGLFCIEARQPVPGAETGGAPAVLGVVGEEPRVGLLEGLPAAGAGALGREGCLGAIGPVQDLDQAHQPLADVQGLGQQGA